MTLCLCTAIEAFSIRTWYLLLRDFLWGKKPKTTTQQQSLKKEWETARGEHEKSEHFGG